MVRLNAYFRVFFRDFKVGFRSFGESIVTLINSLLLVIVYIFGVGISSLFMGKKRKQLLDMAIDKTCTTYWKTTPLSKESDSHYRQF
jgi:hypothetical protein